jgi:hypothetical protein
MAERLAGIQIHAGYCTSGIGAIAFLIDRGQIGAHHFPKRPRKTANLMVQHSLEFLAKIELLRIKITRTAVLFLNGQAGSSDTTATLNSSQTFIKENGTQPCVQGRFVSKLTKRTPSVQQCLLDRFFGIRWIPQHPQRNREELRTRCMSQTREFLVTGVM